MFDIVKICNRIIEYPFYFLFFLVPLVMTPWNYELFEFNKMLLVYFLATIIISAWLIKMVTAKKFLFRRTFLDLPLLCFLVSQFLSFLVSIDRHTSLWGYYSRFHGGLISTLAYLLLYWAFVSNMDQRKTQNVIRNMLAGVFLVASYGIAEHFGIDAKYWVQDVQSRVFSTLGQPNWLAAWLVALLPIPMALAISDTRGERRETRKNVLRIAYYLLPVILYICLLFTKSRSGLFGFAAAYFVFWGAAILLSLKPKKTYVVCCLSSVLKCLSIFTFSFLLFTFLIGTPWTPNVGEIYRKLSSVPPPTSRLTSHISPPSPIGYGTESGEIRKIVWKGAIEVWKHHPLLGTGPETFAYSYYWYRPQEHNDVSEWDFLYNKAHNEYLNFLATTGIVGLVSYLLMIGSFSFWTFKTLTRTNKKRTTTNKQIKKHPHKFANIRINSHEPIFLTAPNTLLIIALFSGYCGILVTNFFGFSVVAVALLFFLYPAMAVTLPRQSRIANMIPPPERKRSCAPGVQQWFGIGITLLFTSYSLLFIAKYWRADTFFARGEKLNQAGGYQEALRALQKATRIYPGEPTYHNELGLAAANLAFLFHQQGDSSASAHLIELAVSESDKVLKISPYHLNFWKNRVRIFYRLSEIDSKYNKDTLKALLRSVELASTDAKIHYNLALMFARVGENQLAVETMEKTIQLKPNYDSAYYALALFYEKEGRIQETRQLLEYVLNNINPDHKPSQEKLETL